MDVAISPPRDAARRRGGRGISHLAQPPASRARTGPARRGPGGRGPRGHEVRASPRRRPDSARLERSETPIIATNAIGTETTAGCCSSAPAPPVGSPQRQPGEDHRGRDEHPPRPSRPRRRGRSDRDHQIPSRNSRAERARGDRERPADEDRDVDPAGRTARPVDRDHHRPAAAAIRKCRRRRIATREGARGAAAARRRG